ncbi:TonB-dependent receptor [Fretibacter rubidus]|uniref:TonB-dependent receptor n=1 Tax=Fretibacter rubidus TaxID=570162 RepID=UPI00352AD01A
MHTTRKRLISTSSLLSIIGVGALLAMPTVAQAQIDEIVTTAQRRTDTVQNVPVAVTVISAEDLETKQISGTLDLQKTVPNLNLATNTGTANAARIFLRGIGEDESRGAVEPAIGTYVDGVYYGRLVGSLFDLVDLEQIEVLRGPQGTLYGRNSNGGAIKITTVKPQDETSFSGKITVGNYERLDIKGTANLAVTDNTAVRISGLMKSRDGFFDINPSGAAANEALEGVGKVDTLALRGMLSHDFGNGWDVLLTGDMTNDDSDPIPASIVDSLDRDGNIFTVEPAPGANCATGTTAPAGPFQFTRPVGCFNGHSNETRSRGLAATINGDLGGYALQTITSYRTLNDDLSSHIGFPFAQETDQDQFSQEITLSSNLEGPFNYVVGAFYFKEDLQLDTAFVFPFTLTSESESIAFFGQGEYAVTDRATVTAGVRYTDESRDFFGQNLSSGLSNTADQSFDNLSYTAKLDYDVTDDIMVYGSYSTGFKGAGFSPDCFGPTGCFLPVQEEEVKTIELGFRSQFMGDTLRFNGTYFNNQYDNLQIAATVPGLGFTRFNVDETEIQGFEFDMLWQPVENFEIAANLGLLDGEYQQLTLDQATALTNSGVPCVGGVPTVECALGLGLKNAPDYKANVAATYTLPLTSGDLSFSGDVSFEDDSFNLVANSPASALSEIPTLVNARIAYRPDDSYWNIALWAKNLTDEEYFRAGTATGNAVYAAEPATYGVDIGFNF